MAANQAKICKLSLNVSKKLLFRHYSRCKFLPNFVLVIKKGESTTVSNVLIINGCHPNNPCMNSLTTLSHLCVSPQTRKFSTTNEKRRKGEYQGPQYDDDEDKPKDIGLMDFPQIKWPNFFKAIKNRILTSFIIRPYFDQDFSIEDFGIGARKAFLVVSSLLRESNFDGLTGLLAPSAIEEMKRNYRLLTPAQLQGLTIKDDDIYFSFPFQIGIMLDEVDGIQKRHVEITYCYHCLLGLDNVRSEINGPGDLMRYKERIFMGNCRFIKEFTKGVDSDWTMNVFNVFKIV